MWYATRRRRYGMYGMREEQEMFPSDNRAQRVCITERQEKREREGDRNNRAAS